MKTWLSDQWQSFLPVIENYKWILAGVVVTASATLVFIGEGVPQWLHLFAQTVLFGASTAVFTRFMGSVGMFRQALSDILLEDKWIDRRNDLDELWQRIGLKIFMPGLKRVQNDEFLRAVQAAIRQGFIRGRRRVTNFYCQNGRQRIVISWADSVQRKLRIESQISWDVVPFEETLGADYKIIFFPTAGQSLADYEIEPPRLVVDGRNLTLMSFPLEEGIIQYSTVLRGAQRFSAVETIIYVQDIVNDPIFIFGNAKTVWRLNVVVVIRAANLHVTFQEFSPEPLFTKIRNEPEMIERDTQHALLPEQAFGLIFAKQAPDVQTS